MEKPRLEISQGATTKEMTPHRAVGLMLRRDELTAEEKVALDQVCQLHPHIKRASALFQLFTQMRARTTRRGVG